MKKRLAVGILAVCAAACLVAGGCAVNPTQEELDRLQGGHSIENGEYENGYLGSFAQDADMTVDGVLDEDVWQNNGTAYTFTHEMSTEANPVSMTTMSYLGENGLYVAFDVSDQAIYYSSDRRASGNTSVELYVGAVDAVEWNGNSFRISVVPTGQDSCTTEMRTYRTKTAVYHDNETLNTEWALWNKAHIAGCHIDGMGINTSSNNGYSIELFIPWESLGLSEKPEMVQYMTAFYHVESEASDAASVWTKCNPNCGTNALGSYLVASNDAIGLYSEMADAWLTPVDSYMTIDGVFDEDVWNLQNEFVYEVDKPANSVYATVGTTAHLSDKGVYLAVRVRDSEIHATNARAVNLNTSLEIWLQSADANAVSTESIQLRVDALGNVAKHCGRETNSFSEKYFKSVSAVQLLGCEEQDGVVSSTNATGFDVEIFIPYESLGLAQKPETIAVYPQYIHAEDIENTTKPSSNNDVWSFFQLSNQTTAKTNSRNAFVRLSDGSYPSELYADDLLFNASELTADGGYTTEISVTRRYTGTISNCFVNILPASVKGVQSKTDGVTFTEGTDGYTIAFTKAFVDSIDEVAPISAEADGAQLTFSAIYLPVMADGRITEADGYQTLPVGFSTVDGNGYESSAVIYSRVGEYGVAFGIVMDQDYINVQGNAAGNNGGGIEIRMANATDAVTGLWWRIFSDGTVRTNTSLTAGAPSTDRTTTPVGSVVFGVGTVANDPSDLSKGYNQMTVEFYVPYSAVGASSAEDFYLAVGLIATRKSDNGTLRTVWMDGSSPDPAVPTQDGWLHLSDLDTAKLSATSVQAFFGQASFRMDASISEYLYFTGVEFTGGGTVTEGEKGYYSYTMSGTQTETLTARLGTGTYASTAEVTFTYSAPPISYDGKVDENDAYANVPYTFYAVNSQEMELTVYVYYDTDGVGVAIVMDSAYINYGTAATGNNGGGFELRMANATDAGTGLWWRVFADGTVRTSTNLAAGAPSTDRTDTPVGSLAFKVGLVANDEQDLSKGYNRMTAEFYVPYSAIGATNAENFFIAIGAIATKSDNTSMATRWMDGSATTIPVAQNWLTAAKIVGAAPADQSVIAAEGVASFRVGSALSEFVYFKNVTFGDKVVTEGKNGYYTYTMTGTGTEVLTATAGEKTASITLVYEGAPTLDGTVSADEYEHSFSFSTAGAGKDDNDYATVTIDWIERTDAIYIAFKVSENTAKTLTNTGSGNQGTAGVNFVISNAGFETSDYYRAYASGLARSRYDFGGGSYVPGAPAELDNMKGSEALPASGETATGITEYVLEWKISFADFGVDRADGLYFLFGWINSGSADRVYDKTDGTVKSTDSVIATLDNYLTIADMLALEAAQAGQEA